MVTVELRRTAVVKLDVDDHAHRLLKETIDRFKQAAQMVADEGWNGTDEGSLVTSKPELHDRTYDAVREATDELNADHRVVGRTGVHRQAPPFTAEKVTRT